MNPNVSDVHVDVALTNVSVKYTNESFIAEKIFPVIPVKKDSDKFFIYGKQNLKQYNLERAMGTRAKEADWQVSATGYYLTKERAVEMKIPDELKENADEPIKIEEDTTENATEIIKIALEKEVSDFLQTDANFGTTTTPSTKWDDPDVDIVSAILDAKITVKNKILRPANTIVVSDRVHNIIKSHPKVVDYYKYVRGGTLDVEILKELFGVKNYLVGVSGYDSAKEGQSDNITSIWADDCYVIYVPENPGIKQISFGYLFRKSNYPQVERWREDAIKSDWIRVSDKYDIKLVDKYAGYKFKSVLA